MTATHREVALRAEAGGGDTAQAPCLQYRKGPQTDDKEMGSFLSMTQHIHRDSHRAVAGACKDAGPPPVPVQ